MPLSVAIVGTGPAGCYTAEALVKRGGVLVDLVDRLPTPFGLVRAGVAPDHQAIKAVARRFEATAASAGVRLLGNVEVGRDVTLADLLATHDAVVLATGAPADRGLGVPGEGLPGVIGSAAFVGWYNGHPDHAGLAPPLDTEAAVIVGAGNVALDCARILAKSPAELADSDLAQHARAALAHSRIRSITILIRRGPHQVAFSRPELAEMAALARAAPAIDPAAFPPAEADATLDPGQRKVVAILRGFAAGPPADAAIAVRFLCFARPAAILGGRAVAALRAERTRLDADGRAAGTGETFDLPCGLVIPCIGYASTPPLAGAPFDERAGLFPNTGGLVAPALWAAGWARRGPSGTIGSNRADGEEAAAAILAAGPRGRPGPPALDALLAARGVRPTTLADWRTLDALEVAAAPGPAPREKFVALAAMLGALGR